MASSSIPRSLGCMFEDVSSAPVLVAFATRHGSTREVAAAIAETLRAEGVAVELRAAGTVEDVGDYSAVVLGAPLYTGRWERDVRRLLERNRATLASLPVAVFALGPRTLAPDEVAASQSQLDHALAGVREVTPVSIGLFGGVIDPARLRFPFNRMPASDARDWDAIRAWARDLAQLLAKAHA
jgi:menaquinone-dependent protoporphyrinogen oxidase